MNSYSQIRKQARFVATALCLLAASTHASTTECIDQTSYTQADCTQLLDISSDFPFEKHYVKVNGSSMAYVDEGSGPVVLFIHGNPTSSYLWRNIIPYVSNTHRAIAVDLMGMGNSDKPAIDYRFATHASYLQRFIEVLGLKDITLVVHDWGSALGMHYAQHNEQNVRGLVFMEALIPPVFPASSYEVLEDTGELFRKLRTANVGEKMILEDNFFVEVILGEMGVIRSMTEKELDHYREPFVEQASRKPMLVWPREIPIGGSPDDVADIIASNGAWLETSGIPKLYYSVNPGALNPAWVAEHLSKTVLNLKSIQLGAGTHYIQEDHPHKIGQSLSQWLKTLDSASTLQ